LFTLPSRRGSLADETKPDERAHGRVFKATAT
jgi:hypothetical protein